MCLGIKWFCALAICSCQMLTLKPLTMRLGAICNRRMPTLKMMLCGALAPAQPLKWTNVKMMWSCAMSQSPQLAKRCRNNCNNLCSCATRCDDDIVHLRLQLSDIMMQSNACDCNPWLNALPQVNMKCAMICALTQIDVMMQSNACDFNCWLCASPQVNMKVNDAILCLWSNLWKIVKLTGLLMILASYYGINLLKFARTMTAWALYIWGDCAHCYLCRCLCENKTAICVRLMSLNMTPPK